MKSALPALLLLLLPAALCLGAEPAPAGLPAGTTGQDYPLPEAPATRVTYAADHFEYDESSAVMHLKGRVLLKESTWTVRGEEFWINGETHR
ncbi:MAG: hypothetical protein WC943_12745, partial [Elusimicrobiota bacterium]